MNGNYKGLVLTMSALAIVVAVCAMVYCIVEEDDCDDYSDIKYTFYVGLGTLYDDSTYDTTVEESLLQYLRSEGQGFTVYRAHSGYDAGQNFIDETTIVLILNDADQGIVDGVVDIVKGYSLAVMIEGQPVDSELYV